MQKYKRKFTSETLKVLISKFKLMRKIEGIRIV